MDYQEKKFERYSSYWLKMFMKDTKILCSISAVPYDNCKEILQKCLAKCEMEWDLKEEDYDWWSNRCSNRWNKSYKKCQQEYDAYLICLKNSA